MNSSNYEWWIRSGQAAQAAHDIAWAVMIVFIVIAYLIWRGEK